MAAAYSINTQKVEIYSSNGMEVSHPQFIGTFSISSRLNNLGIKEGAKVVVMKPEKRDARFISAGSISKVMDIAVIEPTPHEIKRSAIRGGPPPRKTYRHSFEISINEKLEQNNLLSELEYSLKEVYRYNNPSVHFHTQYRDLMEEDYDTIIQGWIYTIRTVFGKLVNSIPRQNKLEFMLQAMNEFSTIDFAEVPLKEGLDFLHNYIEKRILNRGRLLVETNRIVKEKLNDLLIPHEVGFINPETKRHNNLNTQAEYFEKLFSLERKHDLKKYVQNTISENSQLESRFDKIFKNATWPIDLKL